MLSQFGDYPSLHAPPSASDKRRMRRPRLGSRCQAVGLGTTNHRVIQRQPKRSIHTSSSELLPMPMRKWGGAYMQRSHMQ